MYKNRNLSRATVKLSCLCVSYILCSSVWSATATTTFLVQATVNAACTVTANPLNFGTYNPLSVTDLDQTSTIAVTCTSTTPYNVGLSAGTGTGATVTTRAMTRSSGGNQLPYALYRDASRTLNWGNTVGTDTLSGTGSGLAQNLTVYGRIPAGANVPTGSYQDTIDVTVTY